jgi:3-methyl-2-oxobutanoate hydroxymethyltransferase
MRVTIPKLQERARGGEKLVMLTCYDASFAALSEAAGVDMLLVGDSLGMVIQGHDSTLPVTLEQMEYHVRCVARASTQALVVADMTFGSFQESREQAFRSSARMIAAGAQMVKLEGGALMVETTRFLVERGIPVCAHLGLTPQSVHALGGWRVQGRDEKDAATLRRHARELADAGAAMIVVELVPASLARALQSELPVPLICICAGAGCAGQVLVLHDMLGLTAGPRPRFVRDFMVEGGSIEHAVRRYVQAVKDGSFPDDQLHSH